MRMQESSLPASVPTRFLWHFPVVMILAIYLPAALFGAYVFRDGYAGDFLVLLLIFAGSYYGLYPWFARLLRLSGLRNSLSRFGQRIDWQGWSWVAVIAYLATIAVAAFTVPATPLGVALRGGDLLEIAAARADFLANREGSDVLLRYSAVILGRSVLPLLVAYAYWADYKGRHIALAALLIFYSISLEKSLPIYAFLPLIVLRLSQRRWGSAWSLAALLLACIGLLTFLSMGSLSGPARLDVNSADGATTLQRVVPAKDDEAEIERHGDPSRHYIFDLSKQRQTAKFSITDQFLWIVNRMVWIPYITAYDYLKFQDDVLGGQLVLGRSIGLVSWLMGESRLALERMVYRYEFGASPHAGGASNTVFFVDAKVNFGWPGAVLYSALFALFAAIIFSSDNPVAQMASLSSFYVASLSSLSGTLLSGGLLFYLMISLLTRLRHEASPMGRTQT
jgi:hypothetical protein